MSRTIEKSVVIITVLTMISKMLGFGREVLMAYFFGAGTVTDAYLMALAIPMIIYGGVLISIGSGCIPIYGHLYENISVDSGNRYINNMLNVITLAAAVLAVACILNIHSIVSFIAPGFSGELFEMTVAFSRVTFVALIFHAAYYILMPFVRYNGYHEIEQKSGLVSNTVLLLSIAVSGIYDYRFLTYGILISYGVRMAYALTAAIRQGFKPRVSVSFHDENFLKTLTFSAPIYIGTAVVQINALVDRLLASRLAVGSVSALNYGNTLLTFAVSVLMAGMTSLLYPLLVKESTRKNEDRHRAYIGNAIEIMLLIMMPLTIGLIVLSQPGIRLLYERGAFDGQATLKAASALIFYSIGILPMVIRNIVSDAFLSVKDSRSPLYLGVFNVIVNIVASVILVGFMGHNGLALGTSIAGVLTLVPVTYLMKRKLNFSIWSDRKQLIAKCLTASILMGSAVKGTYIGMMNLLSELRIGEGLATLISIVVGVIIYWLLLVFVFGVKEASYWLRRLYQGEV